jgi:hypothetical protein
MTRISSDRSRILPTGSVEIQRDWVGDLVQDMHHRPPTHSHRPLRGEPPGSMGAFSMSTSIPGTPRVKYAKEDMPSFNSVL